MLLSQESKKGIREDMILCFKLRWKSKHIKLQFPKKKKIGGFILKLQLDASYTRERDLQ